MTSWRSLARGISAVPAVPAVRGYASQRLVDRVQLFAMDLAARANTVTGYTGIEEIKQRIKRAESDIGGLKSVLEAHRNQYTAAVTNHSSVQRAINDLLHRKSEWTAADVDRLSKLYKEDHATERALEEAKKSAEAKEAALEAHRVALGQLIMDRYREEQIWSDKIRQFSTWGTMILMAVNLLLFVSVQLFVEPWKRRRLVEQFEQRLAPVSPPALDHPPLDLPQRWSEIKDAVRKGSWQQRAANLRLVLASLWARVCMHLAADTIDMPMAAALAYLWVGCLGGFILGRV